MTPNRSDWCRRKCGGFRRKGWGGKGMRETETETEREIKKEGVGIADDANS